MSKNTIEENYDDGMNKMKMALTRKNDYQLILQYIHYYMGTMAQCRTHSVTLYHLGIIPLLVELLHLYKTICQDGPIQEHAFELLIACCGAIRDVSCANGDGMIRQCIFESGGVVHFGALFRMYHIKILPSTALIAEEVASPEELKLFTSVCGAMRNITHSCKNNCVKFHELGTTRDIITMLLSNSIVHSTTNENDEQTKSIALPDATSPYRECCFRAAGALINISEKCRECAQLCCHGQYLDRMIELLIDAWGGKDKVRPIHAGLVAILRYRVENVSIDDRLNDMRGTTAVEVYLNILNREEKRKTDAQSREKLRKLRKRG